MADEATDNKPQPAEPAKRKLPVKTAIVLLIVLVIEAVAISAAFLLAGGPEPVQADPASIDAMAAGERPVEVLVVSDKFQNTRTGRAYLYDTDVYIVIRQKHRAETEMAVEDMRAQVQTDIAHIFRKAEPSHLLEPELSTITRQIHAALNRRFGNDETGEPIIQEVLIPECKRFRSDL